MSAYVVDDITINRILAAIDHVVADGSGLRYLLEREGYDIRDDGELARLGSALWNLNVRSVRTRYNDNGPLDNLPGTGECEYHYQKLPADLRQAAESIRCWTYQSCEGDCDQDPLFKLIDHDVQIAILRALVERYAPKPTKEWE